MNFLGYLFYFLLFLIIIPYLVIDVELAYAKKHFPMSDGPNLVYTFLRFPTWWIIGIIDLVFLVKFSKK